MEEANINWKLLRPGQAQGISQGEHSSKKESGAKRARTRQSASGCCAQWVHCGYERHQEIMCSEAATETSTKNHPQHKGKSDRQAGSVTVCGASEMLT